MQHHPHSSDVAKVAEMYERLASVYGDAPIDMDNTHITRRNGVCHACAAGWVALELAKKDGGKVTWRKDLAGDVEGAYASSADADAGAGLRYEPGAKAVAEMLGFKGEQAIDSCEEHYHNEADIWGAKTGNDLFTNARAYKHVADGDKLTLLALARQWRGVERRTRERETQAALFQNKP